jgi:hypothetical protein
LYGAQSPSGKIVSAEPEGQALAKISKSTPEQHFQVQKEHLDKEELTGLFSLLLFSALKISFLSVEEADLASGARTPVGSLALTIIQGLNCTDYSVAQAFLTMQCFLARSPDPARSNWLACSLTWYASPSPSDFRILRKQAGWDLEGSPVCAKGKEYLRKREYQNAHSRLFVPFDCSDTDIDHDS